MTREQAGLALLTVVVVAWIAMWRGLRRRASGHADLPELVDPPEIAEGVVAAQRFEVTYVTTTTAGDWLDRVLRHGLGHRGPAVAELRADGVLVERRGAVPVWIGVQELLGVRRESGMAGKFVEREGLVVLTWRHGPRVLDTGLRPAGADDTAPLVQAVEALLASRTTP